MPAANDTTLIPGKSPSASVVLVRGIDSLINDSAGDYDWVLEQAKIKATVLNRIDGMISLQQLVALWDKAAKSTGDEDFGLHFGETYNISSMGALGYVVLNSPKVSVALSHLTRYLHILIGGADSWVSLHGDQVRWHYRIVDSRVQANRHGSENALVVGLNTIRSITNRTWHPVAVEFQHQQPANISEHKRIFRSPLTFEQKTNALIFKRSLLERDIPQANVALLPMLERYLQELSASRLESGDIVAKIEEIMAHSISSGEPRISHIAGELGISPRTLQRRLQKQGIVYTELINKVRHSLSLRYLGDSKIALSEVAFLLGYSELSAFSRAFRRWTGSSPAQYRQILN